IPTHLTSTLFPYTTLFRSYGNKTNWSNPNCTDVHSVKNVKNLASYMAKYLTKDLCDEEQGGIIAESAKELKGRLWFCSRSLSRRSEEHTSELQSRFDLVCR